MQRSHRRTGGAAFDLAEVARIDPASGIPAALAAVREAGLPDLDFYDQGITFTVAIQRTETLRAQRPVEIIGAPNGRRVELLELLDAPRTVTELATALGISLNAVRKRLARLRANGQVTQHGGHGQHTTYQRKP